MADERRRRSERVLLRIPILVTGKDANGLPFADQTFTFIINRNGARIGLSRQLRLGEQINITNLRAELTGPFRVVSRATKSLSGMPEWGVERLEPSADIWGIAFPEIHPQRPEEDRLDVLLQCRLCRFQELSQITTLEYRMLSRESALRRECKRCRATTEWDFSFVEADPIEDLPENTAQVSGFHRQRQQTERRRAKRLVAKLPLRVRGGNSEAEMTKTENLSKLGICFISRGAFIEDETVLLTIVQTLECVDSEVQARIIWLRVLENSGQTVYGSELLVRS